MKLLSYDSPIIRFLEYVFDLVALNFLTLLLCIPLVTAGAAMTALYKTMFDIREQKGSTFSVFWTAFRAEFRPALPLGLICFAAIAAYVCYLILLYPRLAAETVWAWVVLSAIGALFFFPMSFVFPLFARFQNSVKQTLINAALLSIRHLPITLIVLALQFIPVGIVLLLPDYSAYVIFAWFLVGISLPAYLASGLFLKAFQKDTQPS